MNLANIKKMITGTASAKKNLHVFQKTIKPKKANAIPAKVSKEKAWIENELKNWCKQNNLKLENEYKFHPERKWRFDFCIPQIMVAIEFEGIMSAKSRHTTVTGFTGDCDKYNAAQVLGWKVLRFTVLNYRKVLEEVKKLLEINNLTNNVN